MIPLNPIFIIKFHSFLWSLDVSLKLANFLLRGIFFVAVHKNMLLRKIKLGKNWLLIILNKIKFFKKSITAINDDKKNKGTKVIIKLLN